MPRVINKKQSMEAKVWKIINAENWKSNNFSLDKAFVASYFSAIAYSHIPEFEQLNDKRINLIPCETYQRIFSEKKFDNISIQLNNLDADDFHVIERKFSVTILIRMPNVIFIAIRGTQNLYDWKTNLKFRFVNCSKNENIKFHRGFLNAIVTSRQEIFNKLREWNTNTYLPIYVVGHSLGGALAAILHATTNTFTGVYCGESELNIFRSEYATISSYTFGMPRYGNFNAMVQTKNPYHMYHELDLVPCVPSRLMGYFDSLNEYKLNEKFIEYIRKKEVLKNIKWWTKLMFYRRVKHHDIEMYRNNLDKITN